MDPDERKVELKARLQVAACDAIKRLAGRMQSLFDDGRGEVVLGRL